jgi:hypothetical protein
MGIAEHLSPPTMPCAMPSVTRISEDILGQSSEANTESTAPIFAQPTELLTEIVTYLTKILMISSLCVSPTAAFTVVHDSPLAFL